jgi:hypothetical protein
MLPALRLTTVAVMAPAGLAIPLGEASCLIGFAALAIDENDVERASRLLATVRSAARSPFAHRWKCSSTVGVSELSAARSTRMPPDSAVLREPPPIDDALDAELGRLGTATSLEIAHGA